MNEEIKLKHEIVRKCYSLLEEYKVHYEKLMDETQYDANQYIGKMESRYDTFKEELQDRKNNLNMHLNRVISNIALLNSLKIFKNKTISFGSIVILQDKLGNESRYFIFPSISNRPIEIEQKKYYFLNLESPFGKIIDQKTKNDIIVFRDNSYIVVDVF